MKKKILIIIYIFLIFIFVKFSYNIGANKVLISDYNSGKFDNSLGKSLTSFNFFESYIANYNYGNILYQNEEYEKAIEEYKKALKGVVPKEKECSIRINYALAICKTVEVDEENQDSIKSAIEKYESAIEVLTKNGCANKTNNRGHSKNAEQLKQDIQDEIDRLKKSQKKDNSKSKDEKDNNTNNKENAQTIEAKIKDIKQDATKIQREKEDKFNNYNKGSNGREKNW